MKKLRNENLVSALEEYGRSTKHHERMIGFPRVYICIYTYIIYKTYKYLGNRSFLQKMRVSSTSQVILWMCFDCVMI